MEKQIVSSSCYTEPTCYENEGGGGGSEFIVTRERVIVTGGDFPDKTNVPSGFIVRALEQESSPTPFGYDQATGRYINGQSGATVDLKAFLSVQNSIQVGGSSIQCFIKWYDSGDNLKRTFQGSRHDIDLSESKEREIDLAVTAPNASSGDYFVVEVNCDNTFFNVWRSQISVSTGILVTTINPSDPTNGAVVNAIDGLLDADTAGAVWGGPNGGQGNTYCNLYIPAQTSYVSSMAYYCTQTSQDPSSSITMGIYDADTGVLLGVTESKVIEEGGQYLNFSTPIMVERGKGYYLGICANENGARFLRRDGKWNGAGSPTISFEIPNDCLPSNALAYYSNKVSYRYNIGGF